MKALTRDQLLARLAALHKQLPRALKAACPGKHRYVRWQADRPPWCRSCGYDREGHFFGVVGPPPRSDALALGTEPGPPSP